MTATPINPQDCGAATSAESAGRMSDMSDALYCLACAMTDANKPDDALIEEMCNRLGVEYPPQQREKE